MKKPLVAIVDDDSAFSSYLRTFLSLRGYETRAYSRGDEMLAAIRQGDPPDIVLLDLVMKGMYGLDVLTKIRELDADAKVVIVSADIQTSSHELVEAAGARAFVNKPFDRADILSTLASVLTGVAE